MAILALLLVLGGAGWFWLRLRLLGTRIGSFPCAVRTETGWTSGIACYGVRELQWYRVISLRALPRHTWPRAGIEVLSPARPLAASSGPVSAPPAVRRGGLVEVTCLIVDREWVLAMPVGAYTGFASWLESAPPGAGLPTNT